MSFSSHDLLNDFQTMIVSSKGTHSKFDHVAGYESANSNSLVFVNKPIVLETLLPLKPAIIVTTQDISQRIDSTFSGFVACVKDTRFAQAKIKQQYDDYQHKDVEWENIHPSAVIHDSAKIAATVSIGPNSVIGANCIIDENTVIRANSVIEHSSVIGADCIINNLVNVGYGTQIGNRVIIQSGSIIATEGFGLAKDAADHHHRIPHTGIVKINDDVQIGSNCNIDRGTYGQTTIGKFTKLDALVHIAHNVEIGEDAIITAQVSIAGSSKIGNKVVISGQSGVIDHITIADNAVLTHRAGVVQDISENDVKESVMWSGTPAKPYKKYIRATRLPTKVEKLEAKLKKLEQQLADLLNANNK